MLNLNPSLLIDGYKIGHVHQYPSGTNFITSNWVCRSTRLPFNEAIFFGLQYYISEYLLNQWQTNFFDNKDAVKEYKDYIDSYLSVKNDVSHLEKLHKLGYMPIEIRALKEGTRVPIRVPLYTIANTHPDFFWLPNFLETQMSATLWGMMNSATIATIYRRNFDYYAKETSDDQSFCAWQGHDFSFRGMFSIEAAITSAMAHLTSFVGSDTLPAIAYLRKYYGASPTELVAGSVPATEHAVMCASASVEGELNSIQRLITKTHPTGIVSVVSDSFDFWKLVTEYLPALKTEIMSREGKVVIRPDSGDPVKILIGDPTSTEPAVRAGLIETLFNIFGGYVNSKGYKVLDQHIGAIYGDSITLERQINILEGLKKKGFASTNIVLGIGSYSYQYNTRDTLGSAIKATHCINNGQGYNIFKKPKTDDGTKNSIKGLPVVYRDTNGKIAYMDEATPEAFYSGKNMLQPVFINGNMLYPLSLQEIRDRIRD